MSEHSVFGDIEDICCTFYVLLNEKKPKLHILAVGLLKIAQLRFFEADITSILGRKHMIKLK